MTCSELISELVTAQYFPEPSFNATLLQWHNVSKRTPSLNNLLDMCTAKMMLQHDCKKNDCSSNYVDGRVTEFE
jgi:hypothetical protein